MSNTASEATQPTCPEMGQMVCGHCRRLLSYPQGAKHVQCLRCKTVNIVLDANQVGHVKCGSCLVLLMYPYGAPSVRCSSCHFVTEIGVTNVLYQYNSNLAPGTKLGFLAAKLAFKKKPLD